MDTSGIRATFRRPARAVLLYVAIGAAWILLSDRVIGAVGLDPRVLAWAHTLKGWAFVAVTALVLLWALYRDQRTLARAGRELATSEERYHRVFQNITDGVLLTIPGGDILAANAQACRLLGRHEGELLALGMGGLIGQVEGGLNRADTGYRGRLRIRRPDGGSSLVEVRTSRFDSLRGEVREVVILRDLSEHMRAEQQLKLAVRALDSTDEGVAILDQRRRVLSANSAFRRITGYQNRELLGRPAGMLRSPRQESATWEGIWRAVASGSTWSGDTWIRGHGDPAVPVHLAVRSIAADRPDRDPHYVLVLTDASGHGDFQSRLEFLAHHDTLTGLPNREHLQDLAHDAVRRVAESGDTVAMLFLDLDNFRDVNDSLGHLAGDELLQEVAKRLRKGLREDDLVARLGGDDFVVLLDELRQGADAAVVAEKLLRELAPPFRVAGHELFVSASLGISCYPADADGADTLMRNADAAMHRAKELGRNTYQFYSAEMNTQAMDFLVLTNQMRQAFQKDEFFLEYQPVVNLKEHRIIGFEALIRWRHPEMGSIPPDLFVHAAEKSGMIGALGEWVLHNACRQARLWQDAGFPATRMAVNLAAPQFRNPNLVEELTRILVDTGMQARYLALEITETMFMENPERTREILNELSAMGIAVAIDDFGTGYSSLSYLKHFPVDYLKIDRSFIRGVPDDPDDVAITRAILALANSLNIRVVAEGIESERQRRFLVDAGCLEGQGYLFSRPRQGAGMTQVLERHHA
ncbi:MAG TPA: EAL domain-containing protein [Gammaproteobacteria bacterium]|nr:EAL domain-containing protein [Gammaproteobacteria bacterium]